MAIEGKKHPIKHQWMMRWKPKSKVIDSKEHYSIKQGMESKSITIEGKLKLDWW